jgi:DNA repair exonuclease SbcCD ATPase subunit
MANIKGGSIEFDLTLTTEKINSALEETKRRLKTVTTEFAVDGEKVDVAMQRLAQSLQSGLSSSGNMIDEVKRRMQDFSSSTTAGAEKMNASYQLAKTQIGESFATIGQAIDVNKEQIEKLKQTYATMQNVINYEKGIGNSKANIDRMQQEAAAVQQQINKHKEANAELLKLDATLVKYNQDLEEEKNKVDNASNSHVRFRTQLMNVKQQMMELEQAGKRNTAEYARLTEEAKRLANAMYAANQQIKNLTTVKGATLQGFVSGLSGVSGAFTAVNGAMGLFASKNEDLQKIMLKVQSLMSITMGLQAVSATLHQTSAFRLTVLTKVQAGYNAVLLSSEKALIRFGLSAKAARIAVQTFYGTLTLGLAFLPLIIGLVNKWISTNDRQKEALERTEKALEANRKKVKEIADAYSKEIAKVQSLRAVLDSENVSRAKKLAIIDELKKQIPGYTAELNKEGKVIRENKKAIDEYIQSLEKSVRFKSDEKDLSAIYSKKYEYEKQFADAIKVFEGDINILPKEVQDRLKEQYKVQYNTYKKRVSDLNKEAEKIIKRIQTEGLVEMKEPDSKTDKKEKDPFAKELEEKKKAYKEYFQMVNAGMEAEAKREYSTLLEEGKTYKEYLQKRLKDTTLTENQIRQINVAIAGETEKTVMEEFKKSLQEEMNNARNILDVVNLIKEKRKEIEKSDDPLKVQKLEVITHEEENATKRAEEETQNLLKSYSDYLDEKINFELQYGERKKKLDEDLAKATTENERKIILAQLAGLERDRKKYEKQTDNEEYDKMLQEYRSFEQRKTNITAEFDEKRNSLNEKINSSNTTEKERMQAVYALQQLEKDYKKELSGLALEELQNSGTWEKLFGNLDELTTKQIEELIAKIEAQKAQLGIELNPQELKEILEKLEQAKGEIRSRNPFKALVDSVKEYGEATDDIVKKKALVNSFKSLAKSIDMISGVMDSVVNGIKAMGIEMDETTKKVIGDINGMLDAASKLAEGIATKNPMSIIEGSVELISRGLSLLDSGSARRNKRLEEEIQYYNALVDVYSMLIDKQKALTESLSGKQAMDAYKDGLDMIVAQQTAAAASLKNWFASGASMWSHSKGYNYNESFGNTLSQDKLFSMTAEQWEQWMKENAEQWARLPQEVQNYANEVINAGEQTEELNRTIKEAVTGFSLDEAMSELSELVTQSDLTFEKIAESFSGHMEKAVLRMIQNNYLNEELAKWYDDFYHDMGDDFEISDDEAKRLQKQYADIVNKANAAYDAAMKATGISMENSVGEINSLSGAIKGASQQSIDLLVGQTNAVRNNQVQSMEILRNQLLHLASIDMKIGISNDHLGVSNYHLERIDSKLNNTYDLLRSQGLD